MAKQITYGEESRQAILRGVNQLADAVKQGVQEQDLVGLRFNTIGISDGITNGTPGMRYSLVSRDIIAGRSHLTPLDP